MSASTANFATAGWGNPDGSTKIATAPIVTNERCSSRRILTRSDQDRSTIAVWANEDGAGGEVI